MIPAAGCRRIRRRGVDGHRFTTLKDRKKELGPGLHAADRTYFGFTISAKACTVAAGMRSARAT